MYLQICHLANGYRSTENHIHVMGKLTISMASFNSYATYYQRLLWFIIVFHIEIVIFVVI